MCALHFNFIFFTLSSSFSVRSNQLEMNLIPLTECAHLMLVFSWFTFAFVWLSERCIRIMFVGNLWVQYWHFPSNPILLEWMVYGKCVYLGYGTILPVYFSNMFFFASLIGCPYYRLKNVSLLAPFLFTTVHSVCHEQWCFWTCVQMRLFHFQATLDNSPTLFIIHVFSLAVSSV